MASQGSGKTKVNEEALLIFEELQTGVLSEDWRVTSNDSFLFQKDGKQILETIDQKTSISVVISSRIGNL